MGATYVVEGAELSCSMGSATVNLMVTSHGVELGGGKRANIADAKPMVNIPSFGTCNIPGAPKPCTPACVMWIGGKADVLVEGMPALLDSDMTVCPVGGGVIQITDCGQ